MGLINAGKQLLFQPLTFLLCKMPHNKLLMVFNSLINFCFDGGENKYVIVDNYGACWVKKSKTMQYVLTNSKQKMQLLISFLIVISLLALRSSARLLVFLCLLSSSFFCNLFLIFIKVSG